MHPAAKGVPILTDDVLTDRTPGYSAFAKLRTREGRACRLLKPFYLVEIAGHEAAVPITLLDGARLTRALEPGEIVTEADVELPETLAHALYRESVAAEPAPPRAAARR